MIVTPPTPIETTNAVHVCLDVFAQLTSGKIIIGKSHLTGKSSRYVFVRVAGSDPYRFRVRVTHRSDGFVVEAHSV